MRTPRGETSPSAVSSFRWLGGGGGGQPTERKLCPRMSRVSHTQYLLSISIYTSAVKRSIGSTTGCTITEKAPTRAFSWLQVATTAFTFKTLLRHYAKRALTPLSLNVKLGP